MSPLAVSYETSKLQPSHSKSLGYLARNEPHPYPRLRRASRLECDCPLPLAPLLTHRETFPRCPDSQAFGFVAQKLTGLRSIMMQGSSPFTGQHQSPSFHSGSYLPKLEANFMRDFTCCGKMLANLHDLLQHYEESHAESSPSNTMNNNFTQFSGRGFQPSAPGTPGQTTARPSPTQLGQHMPGSGMPLMGAAQQNQNLNDGDLSAAALGGNDEMDAVADMEMDDAMGMDLDDSQQRMQQTRQMFGQQQRPQLNMETSGITQGLRTSQPTTPAAASFGFQHNPTVSSVNTPTLATAQGQMADMDHMDEDLPGQPMGGGAADIGDGTMNGTNNYINDPARNLFSQGAAFPTGGNRTIQAQLAQLGITNGQQMDPQSNALLVQRLRSMISAEEHKPFKCPVIGCEKAYKNQNGLKYHKSHGHQTQQLHENGDGTFSIVNPETSAPYPGTQGMEKEKPFNCETCGKRYKNLNGLKYVSRIDQHLFDRQLTALPAQIAFAALQPRLPVARRSRGHPTPPDGPRRPRGRQPGATAATSASPDLIVAIRQH